MKTIAIFMKGLLVLVFLFSCLTTYSQGISTGGYQGGNFGNVKVKTWSGAVDAKWNDSGNWCPAGVPASTDDVVIPSSATVMPEVDVTGQTCNDLTIDAGAALTVKPGYQLTVNGHVTIEKE